MWRTDFECCFYLQYNFEGSYDLVKFIKLIGEHGMHATLRLGPFIQAEWNHGYHSTPRPLRLLGIENVCFYHMLMNFSFPPCFQCDLLEDSHIG